MHPIVKTPLDGGGIKLSAGHPAGPALRDGDTTAVRAREPARIITMAWGERYVIDLLSLTLPALLAPGNIPAFAQHFDCDLVIVTETRFFERFVAAPVISHLLNHIGVRLVPIDDLLSSWYGVTLTYALVRGFADLGPKMVDTHLVFLNADFVIADGSYGKLAEMILRGERLVVSPSYCTVLEDVIEPLRAHCDKSTSTLTVSRRRMAELILANRHNCISAKVWNQRLFNIGLFDQFYWYVDERTLLCRQMPIAVIYMRPERVLTELATFWDYGVISEYCPTLKPCVLGDSDDFLMAELRTESTFRERLQLGWPEVEDVAKHLSSYVTKDHHDYGRYDLILHAGDLPTNLETERAKFHDVVDAVYRRLSPPMSYLDHPFWTLAWPYFNAARAQYASTAAEAPPVEPPAPAAPEEPLSAPPADRAGPVHAAPVPTGKLGLIARLYRAALGQLPDTTPWHPYHAMLRHVNAAIAAAKPDARMLFVTSGGTLGPLLVRRFTRYKLAMPTTMMVKQMYEEELRELGKFDLCVCNLDLDDLLQFNTIFAAVRPCLEHGGRVVAFYHNARLIPVSSFVDVLPKKTLPRVGISKISFTGSRPGARAMQWFARITAKQDLMKLTGQLLSVPALVVCALLARLASTQEAKSNPEILPKDCTSLVIEVELR